MKPVIPILFGMFTFVCFLSGCAGSSVRTTENVTPEEQKTYKIISTPFGDVKREKKQTDQRAVEAGSEKADIDEAGYETISTPAGDVKRETNQAENQTAAPEQGKTYLDEQGMYEIISTPFGFVKRKKKQPDKAITTSVPVPVTPEIAALPAPEPEPVVLPDPEPEPVVPTRSKPEPAILAASAVAPAAPPAPVAVSTEAAIADEAPEETGEISFDFDDADLNFVIRAMADFLQITYIVDPGITGKVTIHTAGNLKSSDVFPIFHQTLEINGLAAVKEGNVYRILRLKDASRMPIVSRFARDAKEIPPQERIVLQIIPLKFISAQEVTKVITPFLSAEGTIISEGSSNSLLVVDKGINIFKILKLVEVFDVNVFDKTNYRFYTINNADAEEVSKTLEMILPPVTADGKGQMKFIPIKWLNSLLVVSSNLEVFDRVDPLIRQLDVPGEGAQPQIYVYSVRNGMAVDLGDTLRAIFSGGGESRTLPQRESVPSNPFARRAGGGDASPSSAAPASSTADKPAAIKKITATGPSATLRGEVRITDDPIRNALIIEALPGDYRIVKRILDRLDVLPRQVLIDVVIAEISLGQGTELGIEWTFKKDDWTDTGSLAATIGSSGLQYALGLSEQWLAALHALANDSKLNIISSPTVLASDNKQAKIDVTTEVPIPSTSYTYVDDGDNVMETTVEYRDTGVILDVTPHINEYGLVTMDISQEVSNVGSLVKVAGQDYYSFDTKKILTSLTVRHNQSIVIGGLISNQKKDAASGVPWLVKIPILRWFTGSETKSESRSELIVMITPRVITSLEDVDAVSEEFRRKVEGIQQTFE